MTSQAKVGTYTQLPTICPSCKREYAKMPNRERMLNGNMGHLELDPETGATVLMDEGRRLVWS